MVGGDRASRRAPACSEGSASIPDPGAAGSVGCGGPWCRLSARDRRDRLSLPPPESLSGRVLRCLVNASGCHTVSVPSAAERERGVLLSGQELVWESPGVCPSCGVVTDHLWFNRVMSTFRDQSLGKNVTHEMEGDQGRLRVSRCLSKSCKALAFWIGKQTPTGYRTEVVYPQTGIRIPPPEGLEPEETKLYEEAAAVAPTSRRAACALLRVLLEAFLKRHLTAPGQSVKRKNLVELIDEAVVAP